MPDESIKLVTDKVKSTVQKIDTSARIILFGSRARGDAHEESDWDFLIFLNHRPTLSEEHFLRNQLYKIELETGQVISIIIRNYSDWETPINKQTPFYHEVSRESIIL